MVAEESFRINLSPTEATVVASPARSSLQRGDGSCAFIRFEQYTEPRCKPAPSAPAFYVRSSQQVRATLTSVRIEGAAMADIEGCFTRPLVKSKRKARYKTTIPDVHQPYCIRSPSPTAAHFIRPTIAKSAYRLIPGINAARGQHRHQTDPPRSPRTVAEEVPTI